MAKIGGVIELLPVVLTSFLASKVSSTMNEEKSKIKNSLSASSWSTCLSGRMTAAGAPSLRRLREWKESWGATDVVTLQRADEMRPELPEECRRLGLTWWHRPLSGRRLEALEDKRSLSELGPILDVLSSSPARSVVLHCSAGLHRTGVVFYFLLRKSALTQTEALAKIREARPLTAQELERSTRNSGVLMDLAETFV
ncbi:MAG: hypothetical protein P1V97_20775 [Planctomycetota bacterium]|nr:hypothetical protein [Planctomycetota bacterium]